MLEICRQLNLTEAGVCGILYFSLQRDFSCGLCLSWVRVFACCTLFSSAVVSGSTSSTAIACAYGTLRSDGLRSGCSATGNGIGAEIKTVRALRGICGVWGDGRGSFGVGIDRKTKRMAFKSPGKV